MLCAQRPAAPVERPVAQSQHLPATPEVKVRSCRLWLRGAVRSASADVSASSSAGADHGACAHSCASA